MVKYFFAGALCVLLALPAAAEEPAGRTASFFQAIWETVLSLLPEELQPVASSASGELPEDEFAPIFIPNG